METAQGCESFSTETCPETVSALAAYCAASEKKGDWAVDTMAIAAVSNISLADAELNSPLWGAIATLIPSVSAGLYKLSAETRVSSLPSKLLLQVGYPQDFWGRDPWNQQFPIRSADESGYNGLVP